MSTTSAEEKKGPGGTVVTETAEEVREEHRGERRVYRDDEYAERHVYLPHKVGLPPLGHYLMLVWLVIHFAAGKGLTVSMLWAPLLVLIITVFAAGVAMFCAAAEVYFRDLSSFLPYVLRIWMYISPVLYYWEDVPQHIRRWLLINPLSSILASWSDVLNKGISPHPGLMAIGSAWAVFALIFGAL